MAFRWVLRPAFVTGPWRPLHPNGNVHSVKTLRSFRISAVRKGSCGYYGTVLSARDIHFWKRTQKLNCSHNERPSSSTSEEDELDQGHLRKLFSKRFQVSKTEGRVRRTTNVVIGGTVANDSTNEWLALDQKVNSYPTVRGFTAIGTGGDDFVQAMVVAVESVIQQPIPEGRVRQRLSSRGKYVSVNIGPVCVVSREQVQAVYDAMRRDNRIKYFL